jgi:type II secretory pathway predicted ATPase ExeA
MYVAHFGLRQQPFRTTPDPDCYYPATAHEEALQRILQALGEGEGFAVLTGEPGTGKTLLATLLLDRLADQAACVFVTNCHLTRRTDLFQAVLYDLGLPYEGKSEQELRLTLTDHLLARLAEGGRTVLVFDEAHHLLPDLLEELRLLGNLETRSGRAVQVVLVAQPALIETLRQAELRSLNQRITVRAELGRLAREESADYLAHHLRLAGARPDALLSDEAIDLLARGGGGLPRLLNQVAHLALALTWQAGAGRVDAEGALEALTRLGLDAGPDEGPGDPQAGTPAADTVVDHPVQAGAPGNGADADYGWPPGAYRLPQSGQAPRLSYAPGRPG